MYNLWRCFSERTRNGEAERTVPWLYETSFYLPLSLYVCAFVLNMQVTSLICSLKT